ncbi:DNA alkylation repair protein [Marnyiella aurantia]|uniref:DNA alkylation repair protein n=1 Tax=Marnyiella aurantia TaxID=2758037 RepID=A0A7D7LN01_9FLAO|nr:DNA alkylation repair protein [Marnyiella aurantia]MBA5245710.1 DNA alkylation repair protein [Marnyiella aurantia]QMS98884.1 DNA alkylation repair protein [Marnyiella aurantia]
MKPLTTAADEIYRKVSHPATKLGDLRKIAKELKTNHALAMELWSTAELYPRLLAILIMDKKELTETVVQQLIHDMDSHTGEDHTQLADWLMANQLTKDKKGLAMLSSWENHPSALHRRLFWYHQGRLRWVGQQPPENTVELLAAIDSRMAAEEPEVQWSMNFTAGWIGIFDETQRNKCIEIGERIGLYKDMPVARNCAPDYLPAFIESELAKRSGKK